MTLGSIFSKLSGITLRSIAKWYGIAVMSAVLLVFFIFFAGAVGSIVIQIVTALGFWGTLIVVGVALAVFCVNHFWDEIFPDEDDVWERHMRHTMLHGTEYKAGKRLHEIQRDVDQQYHESPYDFSTSSLDDSWMQVHKMILEMQPGQTCDITWKGQTFHFDNQADAILFYNEKYGERKTE